jgi:hypothetical protein
MFHSGRKDVTVDFRLENPGKYGGFFAIAPEHAYFDFLHLFLPLAGGGDLVNSGGSTASLNGQVYDLSQTFAWGEPLRPLDGFSYQERSGGTVLSTGNRHIGAIDLSGPVGGVTIAVDRFWENFPKAFRANAGEIEVGLWPEWGNGPEYRGTYANFTSPDPIDPMAVSNYRFEGGRWKTHRMTFDFHVGGRNGAGVARVAELTNRPPMGRAPSSWLTRTEALGPFVVGAKDWSDTGRDRYERFFDILVDDNSADLQGSGLGRLGFRGFRNRGGTYGGRQFFGWENYGDIMWGEGASSLHYDWSYGVMLGWARSGNYEHYDVARDMAWHRRDYDQNHSTTESWRGCQYYEKGWWHGNFTPGKSSHNWVGGVLLHYAMTGDEASYEAAMEAQAFLLRDCPSNWTGYWGTRIAAWGTTNLLDLYNYLGHSAALNEARLALENFQDLEQASGGGGYVLNPGGGYVTIIWMEALMFSAGAKYTVLSKDTQYLPLLHRMKTWFRANLHVGAIANDMPLPSVTQIYHQNHTQELLSVHHMWYLANAFAQSAMLWNEPADMDLAFLTFEFCVRYHQGTPGMNTRFDDSATYSPMAMRMTHYPNSESKIIGGVLSEGQSYMALRSWLEGSRYTTE